MGILNLCIKGVDGRGFADFITAIMEIPPPFKFGNITAECVNALQWMGGPFQPGKSPSVMVNLSKKPGASREFYLTQWWYNLH